jgi:DEAD/DEAH box helicase domain-containing protein
MACALYIFPTKALAQDQLRSLLEMKNALHTDIDVNIYDGDTPREDRTWIRDNARLLITNPDMLHMSILPCHGQFQRILSNLRYIVIDEAHSYKGAFGCHTALILRRLKRICSNIYGSHPTFIFCTATSANPREHVMVGLIFSLC